MTFKTFFIRLLAISLGITTLVVIFNLYMNEYGLFGDARGKSIKIYGNERTAKYLLSLNYIPSNFNGLLIGSSVSDNIDSKGFVGYSIYNASINGATVNELRVIVENVLKKGNLKCVIISLYPILTSSNEKRTSRMVFKEYWGSLGSINTLDLYRRKLLIHYGKMYDYFNDYGRYNYNLRKTRRDSMNLILKKAKKVKTDEVIIIDGEAYKEFDNLLKMLRSKDIKIFAFYHPIPHQYFTIYEKSFREYQEKINALFNSKDILWDYNTDEFIDFRKDYTNYCDDLHLSEKGIEIITKHINMKLSS